MAKQFQWRRGTTAQHTTFTGAVGEVTVDTDKETLIVHDGSTAGGFPLAKEDLSNATNYTGSNLIINGDMRISQRGTSEAGIGAVGGYFTIDRLNFDAGASPQSRYTMTQESTGGPNAEFPYWAKLDVTTAEDSVAATELQELMFRIEAQDLQHLQWGSSAAKDVTVSFWFISPKSGTHVVTMLQFDATRSFHREFTVASADTWEHFEITFPGDTSGTINNDTGAGLDLKFPLIAGSSRQGAADTWNAANNHSTSNQQNLADSTANNIGLTGVQLEVGSVATDFEHKNVREQLADCQRYFERVISGTVLVPRVNATNQSILVPYNTTKRSTTITTLQSQSSSSDVTNISVAPTSRNFFSLKYDLGGTLTNNFNNFTVDGDSEL